MTNRALRRLWLRRRWLVWILGVMLAWLVAIAALTIGYGSKRSERPSDAAIVLGAAVHDDVPSPVFAARLDHAIDLHRRGIVSCLILTGGVGQADARAESAVGASYAVARGVPAEQIFTESVSHTTRQNLLEARRIMEERRLRSCLLVSDPLHMRRAMKILADLGMQGESSPTPSSAYRSFRTQAAFLARELYFYHHYLLFQE
jgi:uncharacterized SAM-binding protein YcdF (DUF218 family)